MPSGRRQLLPWGEPLAGELDSVALAEIAAPVADAAALLATAAPAAVLEVGAARACPLPEPFCLLGDVAPSHRQAFAGRSVAQPAPLVARLRGVEMSGQGFLRWQDRLVESPLLRETPLTRAGREEQLQRFLLDAEVPLDVAAARLAARPLRRVEVPVTALVKTCADYYGHWLLELLPMIALTRAAGLPERRWLVAEPLPPFVPALLAAFGIERAALLGFRPFAERLLLDDLLLPSRGIVQGAPTEALEAMRRTVLGAFGLVAPARPPWRRLFLSRRETAAGNRPLVNRDEVTALLAQAGFEELLPERLSWREQLAVMSEAAVLVSEDGSLAHNALFAPSGTPLLFLCGPERAMAYQQAVAALRQQPLGLLVGRRRAGAFRAFEVPPAWLSEGLEQTLARRPA